MQKILLIGGNGQLGTEIQKSLINYPNLVTISRPQIDLHEPEKLRDLVLEIQPEIVINAAAYTAVDLAEKEPELAKLGNELAPQYLAQACEQLGAYLIHISTDYVFDGTRNQPYQEDQPTNPLSTYGETKLAGELAIQAHCRRFVIIRTAWVYGSYGKANFVKTMLRLGKDREVVKVVYDQIGSPTWAADLARVIKQILPQLTPEMTGIYHYTNSGVCSWYDFAVAIFAEARQLNFPLQIQSVIPITTPEYPTPAHRPPYSVLATAKIRSYLDSYPPHWRESLVKMLKELQTQ